jgi:FMN phosphatase YigB (HAD superfamily)
MAKDNETKTETKYKVRDTKPYVVFDLDGTLYDSLQPSIDALNIALEMMNYPKVTKEVYLNSFQTKDWNRFYLDLGIREEDISKVIALFRRLWCQIEPPKLIQEVLQVFNFLEDMIGQEHILFVTNEKLENVSKRFERDGLTRYLPFVITSPEGKARAIFTLAKSYYPSQLIYVGDLVSDGEECLSARNLGAENVFFFGIIHQHSLNAPDKVLSFASDHCSYCGAIPTLNQLTTVIHLLKNSLVQQGNLAGGRYAKTK